MMSLPDPALLIRHLITIAERERELLAQGEEAWELVIAAHDEFDGAFAQLEKAASQRPLTERQRNDLVRLHHLHADNTRIAMELRALAASELRDLTNVHRIAGYRPNGSGSRPTTRYLDSSA